MGLSVFLKEMLELAMAFPANVNVAAALGLAGLGAEETELKSGLTNLIETPIRLRLTLTVPNLV